MPVPQNIAGRVTRPDGTPVAGVRVHVAPPVGNGGSLTTGADGSFAFPFVLLGAVKAWVDAPAGYQGVAPTVVNVVAGQPVSPLTITLTPTPTPAPTATPAGQVQTPAPIGAAPTVGLPGLLCGCGNFATIGPSYTTPANGVAWLSVHGLSDLRGERRRWHTGYPTPLPADGSGAPTVVVEYPTPGQYAATCEVWPVDVMGRPTGPTRVYAQAVTVPEDNRPAYVLQGAADLAKLAKTYAAGSCRLQVPAGLALAVTATVGNFGPWVDVEGTGPGAAIHIIGPVTAFDPSGAAVGFRIRGLAAGGDGVPQGRALVAPMGPQAWARTQLLNSRADGTVLSGITVGCLTQLVQQWDGDGLAVLNCVQPTPLTVRGEGISTQGGSRLVVAQTRFTGTSGEAIYRIVSGGAGTVVDGCDLAQRDPTGGPSDKATLDVRAVGVATVAGRTVDGLYVGGSTLGGVSVSGNHAEHVTAGILLTGNAHVSPPPVDGTAMPPGQCVVVEESIQRLTIVGEAYAGPAGTVAVSVTPDPGQADLIIPTAGSTYAPGLNPLSATGVPAGVLTTAAR